MIYLDSAAVVKLTTPSPNQLRCATGWMSGSPDRLTRLKATACTATGPGGGPAMSRTTIRICWALRIASGG
jgi:hypothetical protein